MQTMNALGRTRWCFLGGLLIAALSGCGGSTHVVVPPVDDPSRATPRPSATAKPLEDPYVPTSTPRLTPTPTLTPPPPPTPTSTPTPAVEFPDGIHPELVGQYWNATGTRMFELEATGAYRFIESNGSVTARGTWRADAVQLVFDDTLTSVYTLRVDESGKVRLGIVLSTDNGGESVWYRSTDQGTPPSVPPASDADA